MWIILVKKIEKNVVTGNHAKSEGTYFIENLT